MNMKSSSAEAIRSSWRASHKRIVRPASLVRVGHARQPDRREPVIARDEPGNAKAEIGIGRERRQGRDERLRRQLAQPPGDAQRIGSLAQRRARGDELERALALLPASHSPSTSANSSAGKVSARSSSAGAQQREIGNEAPIGGMEGLDPPLPSDGGIFLLVGASPHSLVTAVMFVVANFINAPCPSSARMDSGTKWQKRESDFGERRRLSASC